jgi:phosphatidylserine/phosphatidylglycerophosphate/cardiolipin synthase-like enzyme
MVVVHIGQGVCPNFDRGRIKMTVHLIDNNFGDTLYTLLESTRNQVLIISPFISFPTANKFATWLEQTDEDVECTVITRFNREEFIRSASSIKGLERLHQAGARLFALQHLHTKLYIFDQNSVLMGSANFTMGGFFKNHELGVYMEDELGFADQCRDYFGQLLTKIKENGDWEITQDLIEKEIKLTEKAISN